MSQKSILSFFKQAETPKKSESSTATSTSSTKKKSKEGSKKSDVGKTPKKSPSLKIPAGVDDKPKKLASDCISESPIKQQKRKRTKVLESDDESSKSSDEQKETSNSIEKSNGHHCNGVKNKIHECAVAEDKLESNLNTTKNSKQVKRKSKRCIESDDDESLKTESNKKIKTEASEKASTAQEALTSSSNKEPDINDAPKRKTARKKVKSAPHTEKTPSKKDPTEPTKSPKKESTGSNSPSNLENGEDSAGKSDPDSTDESNVPEKEESKSCEESAVEKKVEPQSKTSQAFHSFFVKKEKSAEKKTSDTKSSKEDDTLYDPSKSKYHPMEDACWKQNEKVPYLALAKTFKLMEENSARLKKIEILANFLRSVMVLTPNDLLPSIYLCSNSLAPQYEAVELGIGDGLLMSAVAHATGRKSQDIRAEMQKDKKDLGLIAESSKCNQKILFAFPKLTVASVYAKFKEIAKMEGNSVQTKKSEKIRALFVACRECEARYIIRTLRGNLGINCGEQSVLSALARAAILTPPNQSYPPKVIDTSSGKSADTFKQHLVAQSLILKTAYCECPNFDLIIPVLLKEGISGLPEHCQLTPGIPLKPMLAHSTKGIEEVLNRFDKNEFTCEYKYDGERAQIHLTDKGNVKIFSRNQEDNTTKYPDVISRLQKALKESTKTFILDSEVVAWDHEMKQILPFQVLTTRKRKDAVESEIVVQVAIMAFDLLYLNGESLVRKPLKERRELLHSAFTEVENEFTFVNYKDGNCAETMQEFLEESIKGNCEGLMIKALTVDASYEIANRSHNWLKLKKDYLSGVGDTLDLIVIGGYHGKGKRAGIFGGFLLACYDADNEEYQSICKLGTGFDDNDLKTHAEFFNSCTIDGPKSYYRYDSNLEPDAWFEPKQVWEIKCADLSISPIHKAAIGMVDPEKGISLRFPRFLRIREDKTPEDGTTSSQIADMYQKQDQIQNTKPKNVKSEEDYY